MTTRYAHLSEGQAREAISRLDTILKRLESAEPKTESAGVVVTRLQ